MEAIRVISTTTIQAKTYINNGASPEQIELNPWDLQYLVFGYGQKGLLFHKPTLSSSSSSKHTDTVIQHLKDSLSSTLDFFPPLAGRLAIVPHGDDDTSSIFITCNNTGVCFVHAIAENTKIANIHEATYVPPIVHSFFPLGKSKNFEGTRIPLMAVQVTELVDGIFIACSMNHCLVDVKPYWDILNTWAEISRNGLTNIGPNSKLASFERWFPPGNIERPIRIPFKEIMENFLKESANSIQPPPSVSRRIFHFRRESVDELKAKANSEVEDGVFSDKISSLQAVVGHVWRSVIRNQHLDPKEEVTYRFYVAARWRISEPPIPDNYQGVTVQSASVTMKVRDLVGEGGHGKFALEMNKVVSSYTEEKIKKDFEVWVRNPTMFSRPSTNSKVMKTSSSPRVSFYSIDFGWGRPMAVRLGPANTEIWKLAADAGAEEGSFDVELCLPFEILEAMGRDTEFMHMVSPPPPRSMGLYNKVAEARL